MSLECGTLPTQLKRGLDFNNFGDSENQDRLRNEVIVVVNEMARIGTEVTRLAQQVISPFIVKMATEFPSLSGTDIAGRKDKLRFLSYLHASSFFGNQLRSLFTWDRKGKRKAADNPSND